METIPKYTAFHRILHWLMALAMPILFLTGFLRMFWMNKVQIVSIIREKTTSVLTDAQMSEIAKAIREPMWQWHVVVAHIVIFSLVARLIYMWIKGIRFPNPFEKKLSAKERMQGIVYVGFYAFVFVSAATGIILKQGFFPQLHEQVESLHKLGLFWFPFFVILHFGGIILAEVADKKVVVSKMIGGDNEPLVAKTKKKLK